MLKKIKLPLQNVLAKINAAKASAKSRHGASNSNVFRNDTAAAAMALLMIFLGGFFGGLAAALLVRWIP